MKMRITIEVERPGDEVSDSDLTRCCAQVASLVETDDAVAGDALDGGRWGAKWTYRVEEVT